MNIVVILVGVMATTIINFQLAMIEYLVMTKLSRADLL